MNAGNVAAFACGRAHPQLGDAVPCLRSRFHAGDHRGQHDDTLKAWTDPPLAEGDPFPGRTVSLPDLTLLPELDEHAETWLEASGQGGVWLWVDDATRAVLLVLLVMAAIAGPAVLVMLYRQL